MLIDTEKDIIDGDRARERSSEAIGVVETFGNLDANYEADLVHGTSPIIHAWSRLRIVRNKDDPLNKPKDF